MPNESFVDYYEMLQISPSAEEETIQRVFRMLAQRYHPDNKETGNYEIFESLVGAYKVLTDPVKRASYDIDYRENKRVLWQVFDKESAASSGPLAEKRKREGILGVLYNRRQRQSNQPGMNYRELEDVLGIPKEHLEFSLWYLKESLAIKSGDNGRVMITIKGAEMYELMCEPGPRQRFGGIQMLPPPQELAS